MRTGIRHTPTKYINANEKIKPLWKLFLRSTIQYESHFPLSLSIL